MRRTLQVAHRWVGLVLALPLLLQAATGCILAITPAWTALHPLPPVSAGAPQPASAILAAAAEPGMVPARYHPPTPGRPALVELAAVGQRFPQREVLIDPASLAVLGSQPSSHFYRVVHSLHENLLYPPVGRSIVGCWGIGLLLMALSGLVLWWPAPGRWRAALTVSQGVRGARLQRELHGAAGFYVSLMLLVMSLSGITLCFPQTVRAVLHVPGLHIPRGGHGAALDIDAVVARAQQAAPATTLTALRLPTGAGGPVMALLHATDAPEGTALVVAMIDPAGSRVLSVQDPRTAPVGVAVLGWLRALHFGEAFGPAWRAVVLSTGVLLSLLTITGALLWFLRRRNRNRIAAQRRAALQGAQP